MKILLIGEYSNVHWTLAEAFRSLGHEVTVVSSGDGWKDYRRDIDIQFSSRLALIGFLYTSFIKGLFKGYDVVQVINYRFLFGETNEWLNKYLFDYLKKNNRRIFLGAYGDDYFWVKSCVDGKYRYSPFDALTYQEDPYAKSVLRLLQPTSRKLNTYIAERSDGIISCMYEYYRAYQDDYYDRLAYIALPVNTGEIQYIPNKIAENGVVKLFVGVQRSRSLWKGTDIIINELNAFKDKYNDLVDIQVVTNVSYHEYLRLYDECNIFFDQVYSYSQGMNALTAMAKGKILFGGAEPESYELIGEKENFPIFNMLHHKKNLFSTLEQLLKRKDEFEAMGQKSRRYIEENHHYIKVAQQYITVYEKF